MKSWYNFSYMDGRAIEKFAHEHKKAEVITGLGIAGVAGAASAYIARKKHLETIRTFAETPEGSDLTARTIFEAELLKPEQRQLMIHTAARIYCATMFSANGVVGRQALLEQLDTKRHPLQTVLKYLSDTPQEYGDPCIARQRGRLDGSEGYVALSRLVGLIESEGHEELNQAVSEIVSDQAF